MKSACPHHSLHYLTSKPRLTQSSGSALKCVRARIFAMTILDLIPNALLNPKIEK